MGVVPQGAFLSPSWNVLDQFVHDSRSSLNYVDDNSVFAAVGVEVSLGEGTEPFLSYQFFRFFFFFLLHIFGIRSTLSAN